MWLRVTIHAGAPEHESIIESIIGKFRGVGLTRVVNRRMALLAQLWLAPHQHGIMITAVRTMAQGAIF